jgi:hypothetical protein
MDGIPFNSPTGITTYNIHSNKENSGPQETTAMTHERTRPMLTAPPCSQVTRAMALNYIRMLPSVSYSTVGRQDLHVSPNGIRCTCQL